ncbi:MAG: class I SAM-dependent methyltransferase [Burkholderiaceae bacterium]
MKNNSPSPVALFARNFIRHPRMLGSFIPSSRFLIRTVLGQMDFQRARLIVEYGPGVGTFTRPMLVRMRPDATLIALETNPDFVQFLRTNVDDQRLQVVSGSAADVESVLTARGLGRADYVLSGIPFTTLTPQERTAVVNATRSILRTDGAFLVYQFSPLVLSNLRRVFSKIRRDFQPLNMPPAQLFYCSP